MREYWLSVNAVAATMGESPETDHRVHLLSRGLYAVGGRLLVLGLLLVELAAGVFIAVGFELNMVSYALVYAGVPSVAGGSVLCLLGRWVDNE